LAWSEAVNDIGVALDALGQMSLQISERERDPADAALVHVSSP
jgi:hypothetical protein